MSGKGSKQRPTDKKKFDCSFDRIFNKKKPMDNKAVFEQLKIDEGIRYEIYRDHMGYATFGVGHLITQADPEDGQPDGTPISEERVWSAFETDLNIAIWDCEMLFGSSRFKSWPGEVQEILINMVFNMGRTRLAKFINFQAALNGENWKVAAAEGRDSLWYRQVTNRAERLMSRLENIA